MKAATITDKLKQYPIAVVSVVLLLGFSVMIFLRSGVVAELSVKESDLTSRIRTIDQNMKSSKGLEDDTEKLEEMVERINTLLFNRYERAININFFYGLEDRIDVIISDINQLPQPDPIYAEGGPRALKLHSTIIYKLNVSGTFTDVLKFMYELHKVDPLIRVADFQIGTSKGVGAAPGNVNARLRVLVLGNKE